MIARLFGDLPWREFADCLRRSTLMVANILFITYAAFIFSYAMSYAGVGEQVTNFIIGLNLNKIEFFIALLILFTALGALVESLGMIVITVPLLYPLLANYGIDPVWFGIIVVRLHRDGPDHAADRHQPVRDPEHLARQACRTS